MQGVELILACIDLGVEIVDIVQRKRLRNGGAGDRTPFMEPVMGEDQVDEKLHLFQVVVLAVGVFLDERSAHVEMPEQDAAFGEGSRAVLGGLVFPDLADVMQRCAAQQQLAVEVGIDIADRIGGLDHAVGMVQQPAAHIVMH